MWYHQHVCVYLCLYDRLCSLLQKRGSDAGRQPSATQAMPRPQQLEEEEEEENPVQLMGEALSFHKPGVCVSKAIHWLCFV